MKISSPYERTRYTELAPPPSHPYLFIQGYPQQGYAQAPSGYPANQGNPPTTSSLAVAIPLLISYINTVIY